MRGAGREDFSTVMESGTLKGGGIRRLCEAPGTVSSRLDKIKLENDAGIQHWLPAIHAGGLLGS